MDDSKSDENKDEQPVNDNDQSAESPDNLKDVGLEDETGGNDKHMEHGSKVIEPSAEFESEMEKENQAGEPSADAASEDAVSEAAPAEEAAGASPGEAETSEAATTPSAVQDFIDSEGQDPTPEPPADDTSNTTTNTDETSAESSTSGTISDIKSPAKPENESPAIAPAGASPAVSQPANPTDSNLHPVTGQPLVPDHPPKKSKKLWIFSVAAAVVIVVLLIAAYVLAVYLPNKPDNILKQAFANTLADQSLKFTGKAEIVPKPDSTSSDKPTTIDIEGGGVLATSGKFDVNFTLDALVTKLAIDIESPNGQDLYSKLSGLDGLPALLGSLGTAGNAQMFGQLGSLFKEINGQWYEIDQGLLQKVGFSLSQFQLSKDDQSKVKQAYLNHSFFVIEKVLPSEAVSGVDSNHFRLSIDKDQLLAFVNEIKSDNIGTLKISPTVVKKIANVKSSSYKDNTFDVWISKNKKQFNQLAFSYADDTGSAKVKINFSDYDKPVSVATPKNAKSVLQLIGQVMPLFGGGLAGEAQATQAKNDVATLLSSTAEFINNNGGKMPSYLVKKGSSYELCLTKSCSGSTNSTFKVGGGEEVVLSKTAPTKTGVLVLMVGEKCNSGKLAAGGPRDFAVSFRIGSELECAAG